MKTLYDIAKEHEGNEAIMWTSIKEIDKFLKEIYEDNREDVDELIYRIEEISNPHLTLESATEAVSKLENEDGSIGGKWTVKQIEDTLNIKRIPLETNDYNLYDIYFLINMIYSDHAETLNGSVDMIIKLALDKAQDIDFPTEKISFAKAYVLWKKHITEEYSE